jgi:hypothetical protein
LVYERGVDAAVQASVAVEVYLPGVDVQNGAPRLEILDPGLDMLRELTSSSKYKTSWSSCSRSSTPSL